MTEGEQSQEVHYRFGRVEEMFAFLPSNSHNFLEDRGKCEALKMSLA